MRDHYDNTTWSMENPLQPSVSQTSHAIKGKSIDKHQFTVSWDAHLRDVTVSFSMYVLDCSLRSFDEFTDLSATSNSLPEN